MADLNELREAADALDGEGMRLHADDVREAADEIETLRRVRDGMTPAPDVRLMHYRCAALTGIISSTEAADDDDDSSSPEDIAADAEAYARAMLAAEGNVCP